MYALNKAQLVAVAVALAPVAFAELPFADPGPVIKADADITFYRPGVAPLDKPTACGDMNTVNDRIVAIAAPYWDKIAALSGTGGNGNKNPLCHLEIEITTKLGTQTATITDRCADCEREFSVDVTPPLAEQLIGPNYETVGRVKDGVSWKFKDAAAAGGAQSSGQMVPPASSVVPPASSAVPPAPVGAPSVPVVAAPSASDAASVPPLVPTTSGAVSLPAPTTRASSHSSKHTLGPAASLKSASSALSSAYSALSAVASSLSSVESSLSAATATATAVASGTPMNPRRRHVARDGAVAKAMGKRRLERY